MSIKTPDEKYDGNSKDSIENIRAMDYVINITGDSSTKVAHAESTGTTVGQAGQKLYPAELHNQGNGFFFLRNFDKYREVNCRRKKEKWKNFG